MAENNDLSGWMERAGILTPSQRAAERMKQQQQQYQNQLQMIQAQQAQQQNNLRAGELSTGFGFPTYMIEQAFSGSPGQGPIGAQPPSPGGSYQSPAQDAVMGTMSGGFGGDPSGRTPGIAPPEVTGKPEPMSVRFGRAAKAALQSDPFMAMQLQAEALRAKQEEDKQARDEEDQLFQRNEEARKAAAAGNSTENFTVGVEGKPKWRQPMTYVRDTNGQIIGEKKAGPAYEVSGGDVNLSGIGDLMTGPAKSAAVRDFAKASTNAQNFIDAATPVYDLLSSGAKAGITADLMTKLDNAMATVKNGIQTLSSDPASLRAVEAEFAKDKAWTEAAKKTHLSMSLLTGLAYADAAAFNQDGRISDADLRASMKKLGGNLSDPESARQVLRQAIEQAKNRYISNYENLEYEDIRNDRKGQYDRVLGKYTEFEKKTAPSSGVTLNPEEAAAYEEWKRRNGKK